MAIRKYDAPREHRDNNRLRRLLDRLGDQRYAAWRQWLASGDHQTETEPDLDDYIINCPGISGREKRKLIEMSRGNIPWREGGTRIYMRHDTSWIVLYPKSPYPIAR
jgi:hypothetical protein